MNKNFDQQSVLFCRNRDGLNVVIAKGEDGAARLLHFSSSPFAGDFPKGSEKRDHAYMLAEVHCSGENHECLHGVKHMGSNPGTGVPQYIRHACVRTEFGEKLVVEQEANGLLIESHLQFFDGLPVVRCWTEIENRRTVPVGLEYVSSFALFGVAKENSGEWRDDQFIHLCRHSWGDEFQWHRSRLTEFGLNRRFPMDAATQRLAMSNTGSWASKETLPVAVFENAGSGQFLFWQIETAGSWNWELGDDAQQLCLMISGPSERENLWWKQLAPGERFVSVSVAVGAAQKALDQAFNVLNEYRRYIRKDCADPGRLPVIFNDYMNCLMGDATTEKLLPLIDKAADAGAEYFVIDGGWYGEGFWWDGVGEWLPAQGRFPGGIEIPMNRIREKGMIPGLWLEIERMGMNCRLAAEWPDECFFMRHGTRVAERSSYQLDFRHSVVTAHADEVVRRLVEEYQVGFIKMDYNIDIGPGTEVCADSFGDGLLRHQQAYTAWLMRIYDRYPNLIIENCSSGGMRLTYGLMDLHSICSTTDNQDYRMNARISINSATGVCPEQAGVWAYPLADADEEEVIMNMVSALSWRVYLSGQMQSMSGTRLDLIKEAVEFYKTIREKISTAELIWPLGLAAQDSGWGAFGLKWGDELLLSVWRFDSTDDTCELPLSERCKEQVQVECVYPLSRSVPAEWISSNGMLRVNFPHMNTARVFRISGRF
jgi:alpha-galactosidase